MLDCIGDAKKFKKKLFLISYDQKKAYDSVQFYTIRAALIRLNLPEEFINFVMFTLENASSCVKTWHGKTSFFKRMSSVRQGDPLAPLIYIAVTDALHCGFQN